MPFTFAHPAASIPLLRPLGRYGVLSALVIGSLTPDLVYFLPFQIARAESHSLLGLFCFCLPAGLLCYLLFHLFLKGPFLGLLPPFAFRRLGFYAAKFKSLPTATWAVVMLNILCGAVTHLVWDAFTHADAPAVAAFPMLRWVLFSVGGYPVQLFKLLQHASSLIGVALVLWWSWRWLKGASVNEGTLPVMFTAFQRYLTIAVTLVIPILAGVLAGITIMESNMGVLLALQAFLEKARLSALPAFALVVLGYSLGWHLLRVLKK
jgi:hypothetical protein